MYTATSSKFASSEGIPDARDPLVLIISNETDVILKVSSDFIQYKLEDGAMQ